MRSASRNGFESQRPWASGETSPPGLTAISKHPYKKIRRFPQDAANDAPGIRPLDALGRPAGTLDKKTNRWKDDFIPTYDAFFPEYYLNAIQTEHLIRDLSPITTDLNGTDHGRSTHPPGARRADHVDHGDQSRSHRRRSEQAGRNPVAGR